MSNWTRERLEAVLPPGRFEVIDQGDDGFSLYEIDGEHWSAQTIELKYPEGRLVEWLMAMEFDRGKHWGQTELQEKLRQLLWVPSVGRMLQADDRLDQLENPRR